MRLNRGTIVLVVVVLVVIVGGLVLTQRQATAPGTEADLNDAAAEATPVAVFPGVDAGSILRLEVRDNTTGERTVLFRQDDQTWGLGGPIARGGGGNAIIDTPPNADATPLVEVQSSAQSGSQDIDEAQVTTLLSDLAGLQTAESFQADDLAPYGLDTPSYTVFAVDDGGAVYVLYLGDKNPSSTRYYAVTEQIAPGSTSPNIPDLQAELDRAEIPESQDNAGSLAQAAATDESTPEMPVDADPRIAALQETLEAMSTDDPARADISATYSALIEQQNAAAATEMGTQEATGEAVGQPVAQAPTAESTEMQPQFDNPQVDTDAEQTPAARPAGATAEATGAAGDAGVEVTVEAVNAPAVHLSPPQTVFLLPTNILNPLVAIIAQPPIAAPVTPAPTIQSLPVQQPETFLTEEATGEAQVTEVVVSTQPPTAAP